MIVVSKNAVRNLARVMPCAWLCAPPPEPWSCVWTEACTAISATHFQRRRLCEQALHRGMGGVTLAHMVEPHMENQRHVRVVEAVKDLLAGATALDQPQSAQDTQVLRDGGLRDTGQLRQIAGA